MSLFERFPTRLYNETLEIAKSLASRISPGMDHRAGRHGHSSSRPRDPGAEAIGLLETHTGGPTYLWRPVRWINGAWVPITSGGPIIAPPGGGGGSGDPVDPLDITSPIPLISLDPDEGDGEAGDGIDLLDIASPIPPITIGPQEGGSGGGQVQAQAIECTSAEGYEDLEGKVVFLFRRSWRWYARFARIDAPPCPAPTMCVTVREPRINPWDTFGPPVVGATVSFLDEQGGTPIDSAVTDHEGKACVVAAPGARWFRVCAGGGSQTDPGTGDPVDITDPTLIIPAIRLDSGEGDSNAVGGVDVLDILSPVPPITVEEGDGSGEPGEECCAEAPALLGQCGEHEMTIILCCRKVCIDAYDYETGVPVSGAELSVCSQNQFPYPFEMTGGDGKACIDLPNNCGQIARVFHPDYLTRTLSPDFSCRFQCIGETHRPVALMPRSLYTDAPTCGPVDHCDFGEREGVLKTLFARFTGPGEIFERVNGQSIQLNYVDDPVAEGLIPAHTPNPGSYRFWDSGYIQGAGWYWCDRWVLEPQPPDSSGFVRCVSVLAGRTKTYFQSSRVVLRVNGNPPITFCDPTLWLPTHLQIQNFPGPEGSQQFPSCGDDVFGLCGSSQFEQRIEWYSPALPKYCGEGHADPFYPMAVATGRLGPSKPPYDPSKWARQTNREIYWECNGCVGIPVDDAGIFWDGVACHGQYSQPPTAFYELFE